jgi:hypothetical protein
MLHRDEVLAVVDEIGLLKSQDGVTQQMAEIKAQLDKGTFTDAEFQHIREVATKRFNSLKGKK